MFDLETCFELWPESKSVVSVAVPCLKHLCTDEPVLWGSEELGACVPAMVLSEQTAQVLRALRRVFGTAAEIALRGAGGSPNLPSDLLLNTLGFGVATFPLLLPCSSGC